jgi:hypothetical protein
MAVWLSANHGGVGEPWTCSASFPRADLCLWKGDALAGSGQSPALRPGTRRPLTWAAPGGMRPRGERALGCCDLCTCPGAAGGKRDRRGWEVRRVAAVLGSIPWSCRSVVRWRPCSGSFQSGRMRGAGPGGGMGEAPGHPRLRGLQVSAAVPTRESQVPVLVT